MNNIIIRDADFADIESIEKLIETCYRGEESKKGWTTEFDLLDDTRLEKDEVRREMENPNHKFFVAVKDGILAGVVNVFRDGDWIEFGKYAVNPSLQGQGIGKLLMNKVEAFVRDSWNSNKLKLCVISARKELIDFYSRCGFDFTGKEFDFIKAHPSAKTKEGVKNLSLLVMEKTL